MYKNRSQGFTLIELLVVIAIIGILSAVVLASLNTARSKGNDAAIQSNLSTIQTQAELWYGDHTNSYTGLCDDTTGTIGKARAGAKVANGNTDTTCFDTDGAAYAVQSKMSTARVSGTPDYWCIDSTGGATKSTTVLITTACPAAD